MTDPQSKTARSKAAALKEFSGETVTKKDLVGRIADATGQTKVVVKDVVQRFLDEIVSELAVGNRLEFREFGVFEVRERAARVAQNPRTLEKVEVSAKRVVRFKVGRSMREKVCSERALRATQASRQPEPRPAPPQVRPPLSPPKSNSPF